MKWGLTAGCEQEWWLVVSVIFVRFYHVGGGCGGGFCWNWLKLRITVQPVMQKARVVEPKTQCRFVDNHESSVGELVWWAWLQDARLLQLGL